MDNRPLVERVFRGCVTTLRLLRFMISQKEPLTKYAIEKGACISGISPLLGRLVSLGIVEVLPLDPPKYRIREDSEFVKALERFFREIGYL